MHSRDGDGADGSGSEDVGAERYNQMHDVPNVFVTDGACMASSACQNPSITYMALTAQAAHYAVEQLKKRQPVKPSA